MYFMVDFIFPIVHASPMDRGMLVWLGWILSGPASMCNYCFQILDQGFILHPGAFMRDFWNVMDITVVSCALTSFYHTVA